jgi:hypothetical protein
MSDTSSSAAEPRSVRLIFEYDGDDVRLVSQQVVDVAVTGFDLPQPRAVGHYVELRGAEGDTLSAVPARNAMGRSAEVFPEQPGEPITRVDVERPQGAFTVVVPAPPGATTVAVVELAPVLQAEADVTGAPPPVESQDLATFPFEPGD